MIQRVKRGLPYGWWKSETLWVSLACVPALALFGAVLLEWWTA